MQYDGQKDMNEASQQQSQEDENATIPFLPASGDATQPYTDQPTIYPSGSQPTSFPSSQRAYEQSFPSPFEGSAGQPTIPQGAFYSENMSSPHPPYPPTGPAAKSSRSSRKRLLVILAAVVILLLLGLSGFLFLPALVAGSHSSAAVTTTPVSASTPVTSARKNTVASYLTQYRPDVRNKIAQSLHLASSQLDTQLAGGKALATIATAQGLSATQYKTLVTSAFQDAFQPAVTNNNLTQKQVSALITRMLKNPTTLDKYLEVRQSKPVFKATPTAVVQ